MKNIRLLMSFCTLLFIGYDLVAIDSPTSNFSSPILAKYRPYTVDPKFKEQADQFFEVANPIISIAGLYFLSEKPRYLGGLYLLAGFLGMNAYRESDLNDPDRIRDIQQGWSIIGLSAAYCFTVPEDRPRGEIFWTNMAIVGSSYMSSTIKTPTGSVFDAPFATAAPWAAYIVSNTPSVYLGAIEAGQLVFRKRRPDTLGVDAMLLAGVLYNFGVGERQHSKETVALINCGLMVAAGLLDAPDENSTASIEGISIPWEPAVSPGYLGLTYRGEF